MENDQFPFGEKYDWEKRQLIGEGGFAWVYKVKDKKTGQEFAVKQLDMSKFDEEFKMNALLTEIEAMKQCESPYVVKMFDYKIGKIYTYLILELCDENLKEFMDKKLMLSEVEVINVISDIAAGYKAIRDRKYIHRDIKPKNILRKNKSFKITDFGFARKYKYDSEKLCQFCGTPLYMAPQLLYEKQYTDKCDVWSIGLILFEILFGYSPYTTRYSQIYKKEAVTRDVMFPYGCKIGETTKDFVQKCLQLEQQNRLTWKQLFNHPLLKYRSPGKPLELPQVDVKYQNILARIQNSSFRKFVNAKKLFQNYQNNEGIGQQKFYKFLMELDPQITTYESRQIFSIADSSKDGKVHIKEFKKLYLQIDFRPPKDITTRLVEEIGKIAQAKNLTMKQFFNMFDMNKSKQIDYSEFSSSLRKIVPRLQDRQIELMWAKIDKDKSRLVDLKQFIEAVTRVMTPLEKVDFKNYQRATRNVNGLRSFLKQRNVTSQQIFTRKKGDNSRMTFDEFAGLVRSIKYEITRDQAIEMFRLIDVDLSQTIDPTQLHKLLSEPELKK